MDIAFAYDGAYAPYVPAVIESVLEHHDAGEIDFWLLVTPDVTAELRRRLVSQVGARGRLHFIEPEQKVDDLPISTVQEFSYVSTAAHMRILLPRLLPERIERVLYLDVDILCLGSLREVFDVDLQGDIAAAGQDAYVSCLSDMGGLPGLAEYEDLRPDAPYFDSGVLLIDLPGWRNHDIESHSFEYARRHAAQTRFPDQDALNYALYGKWLVLPKKWNHILGPRLDSPMGADITDARLIQQIGPDKLWDEHFPASPRKNLYELYARRAAAAADSASAPNPDVPA
ncbi:glycosyltransferase family 8 protein [Actinomadura litoris]|uniref:glycosyltransferase family 8 protein n=1 Tax=Actinomadura litoris TaxID=2678616 RepID=UPI001FA722D2|nr:glycosyltransferase family 8 protein [Actinomadura litoris]